MIIHTSGSRASDSDTSTSITGVKTCVSLLDVEESGIYCYDANVLSDITTGDGRETFVFVSSLSIELLKTQMDLMVLQIHRQILYLKQERIYFVCYPVVVSECLKCGRISNEDHLISLITELTSVFFFIHNKTMTSKYLKVFDRRYSVINDLIRSLNKRR